MRPILSSDPEAFFNEFHPAVYRFILARWGAPRPDIEDLVQETLLVAWRGQKDFRGDSAALTWVLAIAKNRLRLRQRARSVEETERTRRALEGIETRLLPLDIAQSEEMVRRVRQALAQIDPDYQEILIRRYYDGSSIRAIAIVRGETEKAVESRLARAKAAFRDRLSQESMEEELHE